jgi:hypothetical protein
METLIPSSQIDGQIEGQTALHLDTRYVSDRDTHLDVEMQSPSVRMAKSYGILQNKISLTHTESKDTIYESSENPGNENRKFPAMPARPVYNDFATAHLSITNRNRSRSFSTYAPTISDTADAEEENIPLRRMKNTENNHFAEDNHPPMPSMPDVFRDNVTPNEKQEEKKHTNTSNKISFKNRLSDMFSTNPPFNVGTTAEHQAPVIGSLKKVWDNISPARRSTVKNSPKWPRGYVELEADDAVIAPYSPTPAPRRSANEPLVSCDKSTSSNEISQPSLVHTSSSDLAEGSNDDSDEYADYGATLDEYFEDNPRIEDESLVDEANDSMYSADIGADNLRRLSDIHEESTVSNIVKGYGKFSSSHYSGSGASMNLSGRVQFLTRSEYGSSPKISVNSKSHEDLSREYIGSIAVIKPLRLGSSGKAPNDNLPDIPHGHIQQGMQRQQSDELHPSSTYGDTRKLLEITQRTKQTTENMAAYTAGRTQARSPLGLAGRDLNDSSPDSLTRPSPAVMRHPRFGMQEFSSPHRSQDDKQGQEIRNNDFNLERDVSRALRFDSDDESDYGAVIAPRSVYVPHTATESSSLSRYASIEEEEEEDICDARRHNEEEFYDESVIPATWRNHEKYSMKVRVPIRPINTTPTRQSSSSHFDLEGSQEMDSHLAEHASSGDVTDFEDDNNDWETVRDTRILSGISNFPYMEPGQYHRTGSSLANYSSDDEGQSQGGISSIMEAFKPEVDVIQHPSHARYAHGFRHVTDEDQAVQALIPKFTPKGVNGFPINSSRLATTCPDDSKMNGGHDQELHSISSAEDGRTSRAQFRSSIEDFGEPGPAISHGLLHMPGGSRRQVDTPDSYSQIIIAANGGVLPWYMGGRPNVCGSDVANASSGDILNGSDFGQSANRQQSGNPGTCTKESNRFVKFVKGPPGAFYRNLRLGKGKRRQGDLEANVSPTRQVRIIQHPAIHSANQMRTLSILSAIYPEQPAAIEEPITRARNSREFVYRSPAAPMISNTWRPLYTTAELRNIEEDRPEAPSTPQLQMASPHPDRSQVQAGSPYRIVHGPPRLVERPRESSSINVDTADRKSKISTVVLALCFFFPPALLLYRVGMLDGFMIWGTSGEIRSFGKIHKTIAGYLFGVYAIIAVIMLVALLVPGSLGKSAYTA